MSPDLRFSVLVPARRAAPFLEPCLASIASQRPLVESDDYEILVGVDDCAVTLKRAVELLPSFPRLRLFAGDEHRGAYVTRNTLAREARGRYLIFFDADDLMLPGLVEWCEQRYDKLTVTKFRFKQRIDSGFGRGGLQRETSKNGARGVFGIRSESFKTLGGFRGWPCSADTEFHVRAVAAFGQAATSPGAVFVYRRHNGSLTRRRETNARSLIRRQYHSRIQKLATGKGHSVHIDPPVAAMQEVTR